MNKKKKSKTKVITWMVIIVILLLIVGYIVMRMARRKDSNYVDVRATTGSITTDYSFSGSVTPKNSQILYVDRAMQISEIDVSQGQTVTSGQVLMKTTTGEEITAPFNGTVSEIDAVLNAQLTPGSQLCKVEDYSSLQLAVQVDEYDIPAITVGKTATVTINALNKNLTGTVTEVDKDGVYQDGVTYFNAIVSLPSENNLMVGMSAQATVVDQSVQNVTTLPMTAIQFDANNSPYVEIKDGKKKEKIDVKLGINDGTNVQIASGITSGETVLAPPTAGTTSTASGSGPFGGLFKGLRGGNGKNNNASNG